MSPAKSMVRAKQATKISTRGCTKLVASGATASSSSATCEQKKTRAPAACRTAAAWSTGESASSRSACSTGVSD